MKYLLLLVFAFVPMANAESWIKLDLPDSYVNQIDRDSIKKEGDFTYYSMKDDVGDYYNLAEFKHDCKYNARQIIAFSRYYKKTNKLIPFDKFFDQMIEYPRSIAMIKIEKIVCKS